MPAGPFRTQIAARPTETLTGGARHAVVERVTNNTIQPSSPRAEASGGVPSAGPEKLVTTLRNVLHDPGYDPPLLPRVALELLELSRNPDADMAKVKALIETEPLIAARVISIAQSAFYSRGNAVESIEDALVRLGMVRLTSIFMEAAMKAAAFDCKAFEKPMDKLRRHSTATAHIARGICRSLKQPGERAFMCGLLHDIGISSGLIILSRLPKAERPTDFELVSQAVVAVHEEAGAILGKKWNLPWGIQWVVAHHHSFWVDGRINPLAAITSLADWLAAEAGAEAMGEASEEQAIQAMEHFNFSKQAQSRLIERCCQIVEQLP